MPPRKYNSEEERLAARREQNRMRKAIIQQLLEQHRMEMRAKRTEDDARARLQPTTKLPKSQAALDVWENVVSNPRSREYIIGVLLRNHYDELKAQLDAFRLLKDS